VAEAVAVLFRLGLMKVNPHNADEAVTVAEKSDEKHLPPPNSTFTPARFELTIFH